MAKETRGRHKAGAERDEAAAAVEAERSRAEVAEDAARKAGEALKLRKLRYSYDEIAKKVGYANRGGAYKAVQKALRDITREPAEELLALELETLDLMQKAFAARLLKGDEFAVDRVLRIMEARAKYTGLYNLAEDGNGQVDAIKAALLGFRAGLEEVDFDDDANFSGPKPPEGDEPEAGAVGS
jgi:hypothetical protein